MTSTSNGGATFLQRSSLFLGGLGILALTAGSATAQSTAAPPQGAQQPPQIFKDAGRSASSVEVDYQGPSILQKGTSFTVDNFSPEFAGIPSVIQGTDAKKDDAKKADGKKEEKKEDKPEEKKEKKWYEKITLRGYTQVRFNHAFNFDDDSAEPQYVGDASIRRNQNFLIRRAASSFPVTSTNTSAFTCNPTLPQACPAVPTPISSPRSETSMPTSMSMSRKFTAFASDNRRSLMAGKTCNRAPIECPSIAATRLTAPSAMSEILASSIIGPLRSPRRSTST